MAKAVGPTFSDTPAIAAQVNFTFLPMPDSLDPDPPPGGPKGCKEADKVDACALHVTGCIHGCTADAAVKLASFVACYEGSFKEGVCPGAESKDTKCIESAGITKSDFESCLSDDDLVKQIQTDVYGRGQDVNSFPRVTIGGFPASMQSQDPQDFQKALCKHGVDAAC